MIPRKHFEVIIFIVSAFLLLYGIYTICVQASKWTEKRRTEEAAKQPKAVIVVSAPTFEVPCVAAAAAVFEQAGLGFRLASSKGGRLEPDADSLKEHPAAKAAELRRDPTWLAVLKQAGSTVPVSRIFAAERMPRILFIAGGRNALRELRQTDLQGSSPTPFCDEMHRLCLAVHNGGGAIGATGHGVRGLPAIPADAKRRTAGNLDSSAESTAKALVASLHLPLVAPTATDGTKAAKKRD